ncbi:MAG: ABC transporter ATP-binding protein [Thermoproteota archaeon]|nr:ABC transporter ATP-binding protein [Thermoproteota archaeon]
MKPIIELKNVTKRYGSIVALDKVNLAVEEGDIFSLVGPNGSGKTTLLKIMASIDKPTSGEVYFDGVKVEDANRGRIRTKSTMVFQKTVLFNTTVYKNVAYGLQLRGYSKKEIDRKIWDALELVKMDGCQNRLAKKLSGGEQQRVCLARALALNTKLLLLDEPTANLDPKNASIIEEVVTHINRERDATIVMATHNMFQAQSLTNCAALILRGKIVETGTADEIFGRSKNFASFARMENVFSGYSRPLEQGTSLIKVSDEVQIETSTQKLGEVTVFVRPEDIILSKKQIMSSARNTLQGRIVEVSDLGSLVKIKVDTGKPFVVQITKHSFNEMRLNIGSKVFLAFKASSVHVT